MKLRKVTQNDPITRLAVSIRSTTERRLEAYRAHYEATYGEPIEKSNLVENILLDYMRDDKDFAKALATQDATKAAPKAPAAGK
jgi:hypothetical protein